MVVYVAWAREDTYEVEAFDIGVYSTKEKGMDAIRKALLDVYIEDEADERIIEALKVSLDEYERLFKEEEFDDNSYSFGVTPYELDE